LVTSIVKSWVVVESVEVKALLLDPASHRLQQCNVTAIGKPLKTREVMHYEIPLISRIREARESVCGIREREVPGALINQSLTALPFGTHVAQQGYEVASDIDGKKREMTKPRKSTLRISASRPTTFVSFHCTKANVLLYRLYTTRCIACSRMSPAEAEYRNAQYELFGIKARWVRRNGTRQTIRVPAQSGRPEGLQAYCNL
jgi:hypothetical protein